MCSTYVCKCSAQISDRDGANTRWIRRPYVFSHLNRFRQMHWTVDVNKVQVDICGPVHMIEYRVRTVKLQASSMGQVDSAETALLHVIHVRLSLF